MDNTLIKEACVGSYEEALYAYQKGASRIELCADLSVGGVTPSYGTIKQTVKGIPLPIFVLIRPRGGDFFYTDTEFDIMQNDIKICQELGVQGVVIGALNKQNMLDERIERLIKASGNLEKTFHKAFDDSINKELLLEQLVALKFDRILSSGARPTLLEGIENLQAMIAQAQNRITIVACGGITKHNLEQAKNSLKTNEFHGKLIVGDLTNNII